MKLLFRQRFFSWFDSYDIYDEDENVVFVVKDQLSWVHKLVIYDAEGREVGKVVQKLLTFLPRFDIYKDAVCIGSLRKEFSLFVPKYNLDYKDWHIEGSVMEWDYDFRDRNGDVIASAEKKLFHITDTYVLNIDNPEDALDVLMFVLAIDAEKCSRK